MFSIVNSTTIAVILSNACVCKLHAWRGIIGERASDVGWYVSNVACCCVQGCLFRTLVPFLRGQTVVCVGPSHLAYTRSRPSKITRQAYAISAALIQCSCVASPVLEPWQPSAGAMAAQCWSHGSPVLESWQPSTGAMATRDLKQLHYACV